MARSSVVTLRVGTVIAAGLAIICFAIFSIGHGTRMFRHTDVIEAHFHSINGLQAGAPVALSGVNIGAVDSIGFPDDPHADFVIVKMWIAEPGLARVRSDASAEIDTMGLLGDKYIEITGGNPQSPSLTPGAVLTARDPVDYQAILQKRGAGEMIDNVIEMTGSLRSILDSIDKGHGILSELVKGAPDGQQPQLTLADIRKTFDNMNQLAAEMDVMLEKVNRGQGLAGAMFSEQTNGKELLDKVQSAATSMNQTAVKLNQLVDRFNQGNGAVQRLLSDQQYANQLLNNLQVSLADMKDILRKIDDGQGSVGLAVNDPSLYHDAKTFLGGGGGSMGWGMKMLNGLYGVTHPFHGGDATQPLTAPVPAAVEAPAQASQPPATTSLTR